MVNMSGTHYDERVLVKFNVDETQRAEKSQSWMESRKKERDSWVGPWQHTFWTPTAYESKFFTRSHFVGVYFVWNILSLFHFTTASLNSFTELILLIIYHDLCNHSPKRTCSIQNPSNGKIFRNNEIKPQSLRILASNFRITQIM